MELQIHTVLGASGAIGRAVIQELQNRNLTIRAVGRSAKIEGIKSIQADLLNENETIKAIQNSAFVYLCVGLPNRSKIWLENWPLLMRNVIDACIASNAKLIYLDNVYMYGPPPLTIPFDENHPQNPTTKKGIARKQTTDLLLSSIKEKRLNAVIGRSADFYGPLTVNSSFYISFLERMLQNKAPQVIAKAEVKHTYAYSVDIGKALVELALEPSANGQVYHLPVDEPMTIEEITSIFNKELGTTFKVSYLPPFMRKILSIFIPVLKEAGEMAYQFNSDYVMSFNKFKKQFPEFKVTPYGKGIIEMIRHFKENINEKSNL
jgi:nucleoside-diphosphate-sugar epimerase